MTNPPINETERKLTIPIVKAADNPTKNGLIPNPLNLLKSVDNPTPPNAITNKIVAKSLINLIISPQLSSPRNPKARLVALTPKSPIDRIIEIIKFYLY